MSHIATYSIGPGYDRGVARILGKGVLDYARKVHAQILSHAHLFLDKVKGQIVTENAF